MVVTGRSTDQVARARVLGPDRCDAMGMHVVPALTLIYLTYTIYRLSYIYYSSIIWPGLR